ncbi:MAG: DNA polymerase IV [Lactobacillales bacterium]|nr:DNA polymerase IV [Lactobacillales bacterium]
MVEVRKILHVDMDAFFASVAERDNPRIRGKAVVIARHPLETNGKGVVSTANYEARKFGIHSAMSALEAYKLCPEAVFVREDFRKYKAISKQIREIFSRYTDLIEPMSLDEAYLDVTENKIGAKSAMRIGKLIQRDIYQELNLTCSVGVSYTKFLAKIGSDFQKPCGMTVVTPEDAAEFLRDLPMRKFPFVGPRMQEGLRELGVEVGGDLLRFEEMDLIHHFGKAGRSLYNRARGIDNAPVKPNRERKSIGCEMTYGTFLQTREEVAGEIAKLADDLVFRLKSNGKSGNNLTLKVRYGDFSTITKSMTVDRNIENIEDVIAFSETLFDEQFNVDKPIRLMGVTIKNFGKDFLVNTEIPYHLKTAEEVRDYYRGLAVAASDD